MSREQVPDFELDRGISPRDQELESLSEGELVSFIDPGEFEAVLDAGCGTGVNILRLHSRAKTIIGVDYTLGSLQRCQRKLQENRVQNATVCLASVTAIPLPDRSINKILCMSVLQYLDDQEFRQVLREFVRILSPGGTIILHVKNSSSLYWLTLRIAKKLKALLGSSRQTYYVRPFRWYVNELAALNCRILDYKSFNLLTVECMPKWLTYFLQRSELRHHSSSFLRNPFVRRHGGDLKIKAIVMDQSPDHRQATAIA